MITFQNVSKHFGTQDVLTGTSFRVNPGERVGITGPNGAGKSTIFGLLTGDLAPDAGDVTIGGSLRIGHLHQQLRPRNQTGSLIDYAEDAVPRLRALERDIASVERSLGDGSADPGAMNRLGALQTEFEHLGGYELRHRAERALCGLGFSPDALG